MHKQKSFPLRIGDQDRLRARRLAQKMGLSENRLYSDIIQEGLLIREQMAYFEKLRSMHVSPEEGLAVLDLVPHVPPAPEDAMPDLPRRTMRDRTQAVAKKPAGRKLGSFRQKRKSTA